MKQVQADSGEMAIDKSIKIKMLDQAPKFKPNFTVKQAIEEELFELKNAKKRYEEISILLSEDYENKTLLNEQADLASYLDFHNAWDLENKVQRILKEFDLKIYEDNDIELLSGGEQRRVGLAGLLLNKPDVLLLDEPTNHLDVYMIEFLEQMLLKEDFTLLFISHDRYFINSLATNIIEIDGGNLRKFNGGYTQYLEQKQELLQAMQKDHQNLIKAYKAEAHWMQGGVTARRKRNELRKAKYFELKKQIKTNPAKINKISLDLQREQKNFQNQKSLSKKKMLFELKNISKKLGDKELINDFSTRIVQKDVIAIVGANGSGKSTLLKILLGEEKIDSGLIKKGDFKIGYFDQQRKMLDNSKNLMEIFCPNGGDRVYLNDGKSMHVYGYLKNFLFPKEYLDKKLGVLSGGEKNRVALALLFTKNMDCLILDEPTNDLDIPTINILEQFLQNFQGALIFVSHDRYFVDKVASKLFIFQEQGKIIESHEGYSSYLEEEKELKSFQAFAKEQNINTTKVPKKENIQEKVKTQLTYKEKRLYESLEKEIQNLEEKIKELKSFLENPKYYEEIGISKLGQELQVTEETYEQKIEQFLELAQLQESFK